MSLFGKKWIDVVLASQGKDGLTSPLGDVLPGFPSETLQRNTTGLSGDAAIRQAFAFYRDIVDSIEANGREIKSDWNVLDFGIGWGRIARLFLEKVRASHIHGIDVDPEFIELTTLLFKGGQFQVCQPFPPATFSNGAFQIISAYSVFSHLSEPATKAWILEFSRLLTPGGYLGFTTRHPSFFNYLQWARDEGERVSGYTKALGELFGDLDDAKAKYVRGEFVHATSQGVSGGGVRDETFYGESFIPPAYIAREFNDVFDVVASKFDGERYDQMFYLLRRK